MKRDFLSAPSCEGLMFCTCAECIEEVPRGKRAERAMFKELADFESNVRKDEAQAKRALRRELRG